MKNKFIKLIITLTYLPRVIIDYLIFKIFIKNNEELLSNFRNNKCLIVGNGPSLNETPLDKIEIPSIGMNKINLIFDKLTWRPSTIVCINGLVIRQNKDFFNSTTIPLILPIKALYLGIKKRDNIIMVPVSFRHYFSKKPLSCLGAGSTVTHACLQLAYYLKVKEVYLVGVDHNFVSKGAPNSINKMTSHDVNHFDPNYFKGQLWGLPDLAGSEGDYNSARKIFEDNNIKIFDCTINGKLEAFDKKNIFDLISS